MLRVFVLALLCVVLFLSTTNQASGQTNAIGQCEFGRALKNVPEASTTISHDIRVYKAYEPVETPSEGSGFLSATQATGFLDIKRPHKDTKRCVNYTCTAVRIEEDHILTAYHCLQSAGENRATAMQYIPNKNTVEQEIQFHYSDISVVPVDFNVDEDWVVLRVDRAGDLVGWTPAALSSSDPRPNDRLSIVHHPHSDFKMLSTFGCRATRVGSALRSDLKKGFAHKCGTRPGSSGAPVFDEDWKLVGIHTGELSAQRLNRGISLKTIAGKSELVAELLNQLKPEPTQVEPAPSSSDASPKTTVPENNAVTVSGKCEPQAAEVLILGLRQQASNASPVTLDCLDESFSYTFEHAPLLVSDVLIWQIFDGRMIRYDMKSISAADRGKIIEFYPQRYSVNGMKTSGRRFKITAKCDEQGAIYEVGVVGEPTVSAACDSGVVTAELVTSGRSHGRLFVSEPRSVGGATRWGNWWYGALGGNQTIDIADMQDAPPPEVYLRVVPPLGEQILQDPRRPLEWLRDPFILGTTGSLFRRHGEGPSLVNEAEDWQAIDGKIQALCPNRSQCWRIATLDEIRSLALALGPNEFFASFATVQIQGAAINLLAVATDGGRRVVYGIQGGLARNHEVAISDPKIFPGPDYQYNDYGIWLVRNRDN